MRAPNVAEAGPGSGSTEIRGRRQAWAFVLPALLWTGAFFLLPFAFMVTMSLWKRVGGEILRIWSLDNYLAFFAKSHFLRGLANSLEITLTVTAISVLLAYPLAWIVAERVPRRWQRLALILAILPFWTSYVVRSYAWLILAEPQEPESAGYFLGKLRDAMSDEQLAEAKSLAAAFRPN